MPIDLKPNLVKQFELGAELGHELGPCQLLWHDLTSHEPGQDGPCWVGPEQAAAAGPTPRLIPGNLWEWLK